MCFPGLHCSGTRLFCRGTVQSASWLACTSQVSAAQVQVLGSSTRAQTRLGLRVVPFPGPRSSGDQVLGELTAPGGLCVLVTSQPQPLGFLGALQECCLRCALGLLWGADLWLRPSWQMSAVQDPRKTWLATGSLLTVRWRMLSLGPRLALFFWLCLLPACRGQYCPLAGGWAGPHPVSSPLVLSLNLYSVSGPDCALG